MSTTWTDEAKAELVEMYQEMEPTPQNTAEVIAELSERIKRTPNSVRRILSMAGVYVKAEPKASSGSAAPKGGTRISKEAAHKALADAITAFGKEPDMEIISKLTGKAAVYFTSVFTEDDE